MNGSRGKTITGIVLAVAALLWWTTRDDRGDHVQAEPSRAPASAEVAVPLEPARVERTPPPREPSLETPAAQPAATRGRARIAPGGWPADVEGVTLSFVEVDSSREARAVVHEGRWSAELSAGSWRVGASLEDVPLAVEPGILEVLATAPGSPIVLDLQPRGVIRGRLVTCAGNPVDGVRVAVASDWIPPARTDARGGFVLGPLPTGWPLTLQVEADDLPEGIDPPWWQWTGVSAVGSAHTFEAAVGEEEHEIVLGTRVRVSGLALDADRRPVRSAAVSLRMHAADTSWPQGANFVVATDAGGAFTTELCSGTYEAWCFPSPGERRPVAPEPILDLHVECGAGDTYLELVFDAGTGPGHVTGQALDSRGRPRSGVLLTLTRARAGARPADRLLLPAKAWAVSDADGRIDLRGLPTGRYFVSSAHGEAERREPTRVFVDGQEPFELEVGPDETLFTWTVDAFEAGSVRGRIVDGADRGLVQPVRLVMEEHRLVRQELSSVDGSFSFERIPPGLAEVVTRANEPGTPVTVSEGAIVDCGTIRLGDR